MDEIVVIERFFAEYEAEFNRSLAEPGAVGALLSLARKHDGRVLSQRFTDRAEIELVLPEAGTYPFVSHVMSDAEKGAHGLLRVSDAP